MKKILLYSPDPLDGVSYYRQWGPMTALHDKVQCTQFSNRPEDMSHWTWFLNYDVCLFSRPHRPYDVVFAEQCKKFGLPLWIDYDDALLEMPEDNPVFHTFSSQVSRNCIMKCLQLADVITVSSALQKRRFEERYKFHNVVLLPNALDDRLLRFSRPFKFSRKVAWRGSNSHVNDLLCYRTEIVEAMNRTPKHEWVFWGVNPYFLTQGCQHKNWKYVPSMNLQDFIREFCAFNPSFVFVPLVDNFFNRVKSHLAWIDATLAGAVCLGPDFEEWTPYDGVLTYNTSRKDKSDDSFGEMLHTGIQVFSEDYLKRLWKNSLEFMKDNILLSKINLQRLEIINNL